ncbi:hypothetical protein [Spiroplasma endosymbiont of Apeira syringaria]|uniref:hypothetical protein n=1 Tax=Spiroplasma endosymbiont of Apeira syringaria TaxID=3066307 RepID=UPI0030D088FE
MWGEVRKKLQEEIKTANVFADNIIEINKVFDIKTNPESIKREMFSNLCNLQK